MKLLSLLLVVFLMPACSDDDDNGGPSCDDSFTVDGETYDTQLGFIEDLGANSPENSFDFDLNFISNTIDFQNESGIGNLVYLDLNTSAAMLETGTYNFSNTRTPFSIVDGTIGYNLDFDNETGPFSEITGGSVEIMEVNGNNVELEYTLQTDNFGEVTGCFSGALVDY